MGKAAQMCGEAPPARAGQTGLVCTRPPHTASWREFPHLLLKMMKLGNRIVCRLHGITWRVLSPASEE